MPYNMLHSLPDYRIHHQWCTAAHKIWCRSMKTNVIFDFSKTKNIMMFCNNALFVGGLKWGEENCELIYASVFLLTPTFLMVLL